MAVARLLLLLLACAALTSAWARPTYRTELPSLPVVNGQQVQAVGHMGQDGLNQFGKV